MYMYMYNMLKCVRHVYINVQVQVVRVPLVSWSGGMLIVLWMRLYLEIIKLSLLRVGQVSNPSSHLLHVFLPDTLGWTILFVFERFSSFGGKCTATV